METESVALQILLHRPPEGSKLTKAIISASDKIEPQQQHPNIEKIKHIAKKIRNIELLVEFENPN